LKEVSCKVPKINRVRIVNFSYNDNNRHIIDELFDFYGGENALLSLSNGGGKSVLVQAVLQPVLPKAALLGRKFGDFFAGTRTPSYIMTEWKLDDDAGYLLTGIAVTSRTVHSANEEEETADIRYFTFLSAYEKGNPFDIKNIPVAEQAGSSVRIAIYGEFKKLLEKEAERNRRELDVYDSTREEQSRYERKLNSYGISREEWRELIVKINEAEHGVSEVFSECKTSRRVMEQWIIKYIEKVLDKSADPEATDHKKLETMMAQVAQSLVDNENHIREYRAIESFNGQLLNIGSDARAVLQHLDNEDKLRKAVAGGYQVLKNEEQRLDRELIDMENRLRELAEELEDIALEQRSQEIYDHTKKAEAAQAELAELEGRRSRLAERLEEKSARLVLQQSAEKYGKILEKEKAIAKLQQSLDNASRDQEALLGQLSIIKYSLKVAYDKQLAGINQEIGYEEAVIKELLERVEAGRKQAALYQEEIDRNNVEIGGVGRELSIFENEEADILAGLGIQLFRNPLLKELDANDVIKAEARLSGDLRETEERLTEEGNAGERLRETLSALERKRRELEEKQTQLKIEETEINGRLSGWEADRQRLLDALKRLDISEEAIFDPVQLAREAKAYLKDWENKAHNLKMEISEMEKQLHGIENGVSYLPTGLIALLEEHNLPCYTGEKYLREISEEDKKSAIAQNPLLPYALIATEKEIALIEQLAADKDFAQVIPVMRHHQKGQKPDHEYGDMRFIASSGNLSVSNADLGAFIGRLTDRKDGKLIELGKAAEVIERVNDDYRTIIGFGWTQRLVDGLLKEKTVNAERIAENNKAREACFAEIDTNNGRQAELKERIDGLRRQLVQAQEKVKGFKAYLDKNTIYLENVHKHNEIQGKIKQLSSLLQVQEAERLRQEEQAKELRDTLAAKRNAKTAIAEKLRSVADASEDDMAPGGVAELEGRLEACEKQQNNEVASLREQIGRLRKDVQDIEKDIRKLKPPSEEYKNILYSENTESELESICKDVRKEMESIKAEETELRNERTRLGERIRMTREGLGGRPEVPVERIKGNFDIRRQAADKEIGAHKTRSAGIQQNKIDLAKLISRIEALIREIGSIKAEISPKSFGDVKNEISQMINDYPGLREKSDKSIEAFGKVSSQFISGYAGYEEGTVKEAVKGLKSQIDALDRSYDKYYYLAERLEYYYSQLSQILKIMESRMLQLEHSRKDLTEHAFMEARRIYHEIPKISENSAVEIEGARKKVLEIQYEEMENELQAREKMGMYINDCLESLTKLIKEKEDESRLRRDIEKYMSTKELLNIISRLENCKIRAYKVDLNEKNRKMMPWEDIIVKNSGGEKFVAYFSLLVALISYSRKQMKGYEAFKRKEESKVLIMDNPFGPITSGHLLKPMFDIARKYNTQLICLSDIKQGSVLNSFDLIYMIKIRQNLMQEDFLELEPVLLKELKQDERLENAYLYGKVQQMSLFDL
jgi:DNA repair exonuclease SbcCD ATPase subunit